MACGCTVVSTQSGIQGIPATHGIEVLIGKNSEEIAEHTITLLQNKKLCLEMGLKASKLISEKLSWDVVYEQLETVIKKL